MSYIDTADMVEDWPLRRRITACAASLGVDDPDLWVEQGIWGICARSEIVAAWASARAGKITNPGADEAVITDAAILAAVQARLDAVGVDPLGAGGLQARIDAAVEGAVGAFHASFGDQVVDSVASLVQERITAPTDTAAERVADPPPVEAIPDATATTTTTTSRKKASA